MVHDVGNSQTYNQGPFQPLSTTREVQMRHTRSLDFYVVIASDFNENGIPWKVHKNFTKSVAVEESKIL